MNIPITSGFEHYKIKYVWRCRACGAEHSVEYRGERGTSIRFPNTPEGWVVVTVNKSTFHATDAYCPKHRIVVQDGVTNVYAKEVTVA